MTDKHFYKELLSLQTKSLQTPPNLFGPIAPYLIRPAVHQYIEIIELIREVVLEPKIDFVCIRKSLLLARLGGEISS